MFRNITILIFLIFCISCTVSLTINTDPKYATIYSKSGQNFGREPVYLNFKLSKEDRKNGYLYTDTLIARWISGAECREKFKIDFRNGRIVEYTFIRPKDAPNLNYDVDLVKEIETKSIKMEMK